MKRTNKWQKIIDAAVLLFRRTHNIKRVSLESIAVEAGVSPTTIYNYFGTREALLFEVVKVLMREGIERSKEIVNSAIPFPQKLLGIMNAKMDMASELNSEILKKIVTQDKNTAPYIDEIYNNEIKPLWMRMLAEGKEKGYVDASVDIDVLAIYVDILKAGLSSRQDIAQSFTEKPMLIQQLSRIMLHGFVTKDIDIFNNKDG
ncbi:MAG: TetR/AcrR family transcriptional regulator [Dehalococcoidales bacterium]|nr:TetR/AcrR family transcriptional regulator [Dehalococcoidales bacterium]